MKTVFLVSKSLGAFTSTPLFHYESRSAAEHAISVITVLLQTAGQEVPEYTVTELTVKGCLRTVEEVAEAFNERMLLKCLHEALEESLGLDE